MLRFVVILCLALVLAAGAMNAQTKKLDSLQALVKTAKDDTTKVRLLNDLAREQRGEPTQSRATAEQAYALAMRLGDKGGAAWAKNQIARAYNAQGSYTEAQRAAEEALALSHEAGDKRQEGAAYRNLAGVQRLQGNYDAALDLYFKAFALAEETGDKAGLANGLSSVGGPGGYTFPRGLPCYSAINDDGAAATSSWSALFTPPTGRCALVETAVR